MIKHYLDAPLVPDTKRLLSDTAAAASLSSNIFIRPLHEVERVSLPITPPTLYPICSQGELAFFALTKRMFKSEGSDFIDYALKSVFMAKLFAYENREHDLEKLVNALNIGDIQNAAFHDLDDMAHLALWGVKKSYITTTLFTNLMIVRIALLHYDDLKFIPLFNAAGINPEAKNILEETSTYLPDHASNPDTPTMQPFLTETEIMAVFQNLHGDINWPFIMTGIEKIPLESTNIAGIISKKLKINILNRLPLQNKRVIASLNLMQAVVDVRAVELGFKINPVIGRSSYEQIADNALHFSRDMMLSFPGFNPPESPHGMTAYGMDFIYHDFYHALTSSNCERDFQLLLLFMGRILSTLELEPDLEKVKKTLLKKIYDLDAGSARRELRTKKYSDDGLQKNDLFINVFYTFVRFSLIDHHSGNISNNNVFNSHFIVLSKLFSKLKDLLESGYDWDERLNINLGYIENIVNYRKQVKSNNSAHEKYDEAQFLDQEERSSEDILYNSLLNSGLLEFLNKKAPHYADESFSASETELVRHAPFTLRTATYLSRDNEALITHTVKYDGRLLKFASQRLRGNPYIVRLALQTYGKAIKYASATLQGDFELVKLAALHSISPMSLLFASPELRSNKEIIKLFLTRTSEFAFIDNKLKLWAAHYQMSHS